MLSRSSSGGTGYHRCLYALKEAIGQANVAIIKLIQEIAGKIKVVPDVLVGNDANTGNLLNVFLARMLNQPSGTAVTDASGKNRSGG